MKTDSQKKADIKYKKEKTKNISLRFFPNDKDILDWLNTKDAKATYIKKLIREDMKRKD